MKQFLILIILIIPFNVMAQNYRVSEIKFENFKSYEQYGLDKEGIKALILKYSEANKNIDESSLYELAGILAKYYQDEGLVFHRVQVIMGQPVRLRMIEGVLVKTHVRGNELYNDKQLYKYLNPLTNQLVDSNTMKAAVLQINQLPGFDGFAYLSVGNKPGEAQLNLKTNSERFGSVSARLTNYGSENTGVHRLNTQATLNNILKLKEQINIDVGISEQTENISATTNVTFYNKHQSNVWVSSSYQMIDIQQDGSLFNLAGWQASGELGFEKNWFGHNNDAFSINASAGYVKQELLNDLNFNSLNILFEDVPLSFTFENEKASSKKYSNFQFTTKVGQLLSYQSPVALENETWSVVSGQYSLARSLFGLSIQQGLDFNFNINGQYGITDLPSHRRFSLSGPTKVASLQNGLISADDAVLIQAGVKYFDMNFWKIKSVFELQAQYATGQSNSESTGDLFGFGAILDFEIWDLKTKTKVFTDEGFDSAMLWFELSYQIPGGK